MSPNIKQSGSVSGKIVNIEQSYKVSVSHGLVGNN